MRSSTFYFTGEESLQIHTYIWEPERFVDIKGVIQIAHGMAETAERYERLANYFTRYGYVVYANDHRGHGKTAGSIEKLGYLGEGNGFGHLVKDMYQLTQIIKQEYPKVPIILLGHSMGSFAAQNYIMQYGEEIDIVVLSGSNGPRDARVLKMGMMLAEAQMKWKGSKSQTQLMDYLVFGSYNNQFKPTRTKSDWLTRDLDEVDQYIDNPYCGTIFTTSFYREFFRMLIYIQDKHNRSKVPKNLPIYIFSGDKDPVGENGLGILRLVRAYEEVGVGIVDYKLYQEGRHEMLNEINREQVMKNLRQWIDLQLERRVKLLD